MNKNHTYIGSTNNCLKRLEKHNSGRGAKRTKGQTWVPIVVVSGFHDKKACLSFESGWKRLCKKRNNNRFQFINEMSDSHFCYLKDTKWNRIMDLLYFVYHLTLLDTHFRLNHTIRYPVNPPDLLIIQILMEEWIADLPWPYFIQIEII